MKYFSFVLLCLFLISCKRLSPQSKNDLSGNLFESTDIGNRGSNTGGTNVGGTSSSSSFSYLKDGNKSLFEEISWYTYEFQTHSVWSNLDVYEIFNGIDSYYFQIEDFYHPGKPPGLDLGYFQLNMMNNGQLEQVVVDGFACGVAFFDPEAYGKCVANPNQYVFTYLNLETKKIWKMTDTEALESSEWHIAFRDFDIKINNGENGPGKLLAGLAYRNQSHFFINQSGEVEGKLEDIKSIKLNNQASSYFKNVSSFMNTAFYNPKGEEKVIESSDWYKVDTETGFKQVLKNYWIVKSIEGNSFFKIHIDDIDSEIDESGALLSSSLKVIFDRQKSEDQLFTDLNLEIEINGIDAFSDLTVCLDLDTASKVSCLMDQVWDIKFDFLESGEWTISNNNGAIPLFTPAKALQTQSAY